MNVIDNKRKCRYCGHWGFVNTMLYLRRKWFCNTRCHNAYNREQL